MQFVILDLEWNTAYAKYQNCYVSEIIEFGAVKLNEDLETIDTYSSFVKPQIQKKLHSRVKKLTNITNEDLAYADTFLRVAADFSNWIGEVNNTLVLSWGDMDVRALIENYRHYNHDVTVPFLKYYADAQSFFMHQKNLPASQQIGLSNAADLIELDPDLFTHHRALGDCELTADIFRKVYEEEELTPFISICNEKFYDKLLFKPYVLKDINGPQVDKSELQCRCMDCGISCKPTSEWKFANSSFRAFYVCPQCGQSYRANVQFRRLYSSMNIKKSITKLEDPEE